MYFNVTLATSHDFGEACDGDSMHICGNFTFFQPSWHSLGKALDRIFMHFNVILDTSHDFGEACDGDSTHIYVILAFWA